MIRLALGLTFWASAALATPPQLVTVEDHLFARTADQVFILRELQDNLGTHQRQLTDTLIVFRDLETGSDLGFQAAARVIDNGPEAEPRVEILPLTAPRAPYSLFADFGAWPLREPIFVRLTGEIGGAGLTLLDRGEVVYHLSHAEVEAHLEDTLRAARGILPVHYAEGGVDPFDPAAFDLIQDCGVPSSMALEAGEPGLALLACEDGETGQRARVWVVVPPVEGDG